MIKQQQRVIKKGEYYQMQTYQQAMMLMSRAKKQDTPTTTNPTTTSSQYITSITPTFQQAREKYFCTVITDQYSNKNISELRDQLQLLGNEEDINDEDRKEIQKLMEEIQMWRDNKEVPLNQLTREKQPSQPEAKQASCNKINLTAKYNINKLSARIESLQSLNFPDLLNLQHQLEIMLGEKKPLQSMELPQMDDKEKQEFNNLYNHLNSLSILNNTPQVIQSISMSQQKHVEMQSWVEKMEKVQGLNNDLLMELKQDAQLVQKLETNFNDNVKQVREILAEVKKVISSR